MQKIQAKCAKLFDQYFTKRGVVLMLTFFVFAFCFNVHTRWAKSLFYFFLMPVQLGMSYSAIRDKSIRMDGVFRLVCVSLLWLLMSHMLNSFWSNPSMVSLWTLMGCWIFCLFVPKKTTLKNIHDELFKIGMVFIVCFLPFILLALYSMFSGNLVYVPWDKTPIGIQKADRFHSAMRIMMNPNKAGIILNINILFSIYGIATRRNKLWRAFFAFVILVNTMAHAHVMSRTCIMGFAAAMGMFAFRFAFQKLEKKKLMRVLVGAIVCLLVFLLVIYGLDVIHKVDVSIARWLNHAENTEEIVSRIGKDGAFDATGTGRGEIWQNVFRLFREKPQGLAIGYGFEDVMQMVAEITGDPDMGNMVHVHSAYLDCVARGGIPYLLMVLAFLIILIKPAWQMGMEKSTEETRGLFIVPMMIVAILVMSVSEVMIFVEKSYVNFLFMTMAGYVLHYRNLRGEGKLSR